MTRRSFFAMLTGGACLPFLDPDYELKRIVSRDSDRAIRAMEAQRAGILIQIKSTPSARETAREVSGTSKE